MRADGEGEASIMLRLGRWCRRAWKRVVKLRTGTCELERLLSARWHDARMTARLAHTLRGSRALSGVARTTVAGRVRFDVAAAVAAIASAKSIERSSRGGGAVLLNLEVTHSV